MNKKITYLCLILMGSFVFNLNVFADIASAKMGDANYDQLKQAYEKKVEEQTQTIDSEGTITIYGKSDCVSGGKCEYQYSDGKTADELVASITRCSGGETSITSVLSGSGGEDYKDVNPNDYNGTVYWSEMYYVTCKASEAETPTEPSTPSTSTDPSTTTTTTTTKKYESSSTENSPETGVTTYYVVLGIIALVSYLLMLAVKKGNLFKKI